MVNLRRHINNIRKFGLPVTVAINHIITDTEDEIIPYETGEPGADWLHKIKEDGLEIGRILYERISY